MSIRPVNSVTTVGGISVDVSTMRKHLAQILSKLNGADRVTYKLTMELHKSKAKSNG